jgi:glycosyltransferase involved in cell wall biosynthesis
MNNSPGLSVVILTMNEERNLPDCLGSLRDLPCELFVVDSGSTDRTVEIARTAGATVFSHAFENYGLQRNWALENLPLSHEWVLNLDADERLTPELAREIAGTLASAPDDIAGFHLRRRTVFLGRWIRHGGHYPNFQLRLFRRSAGRCEDRLYDQHFIVRGKVASLENDYIDVVASDLTTWSQRHIRWAAAEADESLRRDVGNNSVRPELTSGPVARRRWLRSKVYARAPLFVRPLSYWLYRYFIRLGFLDGREGLVFHFLQGFWFRFLVDSMIWTRRSARREQPVAYSSAKSSSDAENPLRGVE